MRWISSGSVNKKLPRMKGCCIHDPPSLLMYIPRRSSVVGMRFATVPSPSEILILWLLSVRTPSRLIDHFDCLGDQGTFSMASCCWRTKSRMKSRKSCAPVRSQDFAAVEKSLFRVSSTLNVKVASLMAGHVMCYTVCAF